MPSQAYNRPNIFSQEVDVRFPFLPLPAILAGFLIPLLGQSVPPSAPVPRRDTPPSIGLPGATTEFPSQVRVSVGPTELRNEARQILELSQSIQADIEQVNRGKLPKDAVDKLKRIEKLSRHLRGQINN
jgi:hypothetical protein